MGSIEQAIPILAVTAMDTLMAARLRSADLAWLGMSEGRGCRSLALHRGEFEGLRAIATRTPFSTDSELNSDLRYPLSAHILFEEAPHGCLGRHGGELARGARGGLDEHRP